MQQVDCVGEAAAASEAFADFTAMVLLVGAGMLYGEGNETAGLLQADGTSELLARPLRGIIGGYEGWLEETVHYCGLPEFHAPGEEDGALGWSARLCSGLWSAYCRTEQLLLPVLHCALLMTLPRAFLSVCNACRFCNSLVEHNQVRRAQAFHLKYHRAPCCVSRLRSTWLALGKAGGALQETWALEPDYLAVHAVLTSPSL